MDFAALPPEINSGRMYAGAGSGPMLAAASAWDALAAELSTAAASYESTVSSLTGEWSGPSSSSMAAAVEPYVTWMNSTAAEAEFSANQARAAAAAYEAAFAATVPPPVVAANRSLLATLVATNFLGQNTPAIAATEIHYAQMWAQDAAAMSGYAGSAAAATRLTPFSEPPETTNPAGTANQAAASAQAAADSAGSSSTQLPQLLAAIPQALQSLVSNPVGAAAATGSGSFLDNWNLIWSTLTGPFSPIGLTTPPGGLFLVFGQLYSWIMNGMGAQAYLAGPKAITGALLPLAPLAQTVLPAATLSSATGTLGNAATVGKMSVPPSWAVAAPATKLVSMSSTLPPTLEAVPLAAAAGQDAMFGQMALSSLLGRGVGGTASHTAGAATRSLRSSGGSDAFGPIASGEADPAAATIIVIPALDG